MANRVLYRITTAELRTGGLDYFTDPDAACYSHDRATSSCIDRSQLAARSRDSLVLATPTPRAAPPTRSRPASACIDFLLSAGRAGAERGAIYARSGSAKSAMTLAARPGQARLDGSVARQDRRRGDHVTLHSTPFI